MSINSLIGVYSTSELRNMVEESLTMSKFNHPNVMRLVGVCIDGGESPYIVMPFMIHGSLLSYLRKHRTELTIANSDNMELVRACKLQHSLLKIPHCIENFVTPQSLDLRSLQLRRNCCQCVSKLPRECHTWQMQNLYTEILQQETAC